MSTQKKPSFISNFLVRTASAIEGFRSTEKRGDIKTFGQNGWLDFQRWFNSSEDNDTDIVVTPELGTKMSTIWSCLNVLGQDVATLPCHVKQKTAMGRETVQDNITKLINKRPNRYENAWQFMYSLIFVGEGWGNSYAYIFRDARNNPIELVRLAPWRVEPCIVEGDVFYKVDGTTFVIPARDMIHYRSFPGDGVEGVSKIEQNGNLIGLRKKQDQYAARTTNSKVPGFLSSETATQKQQDDVLESWNAATSGDKVSGTPFLVGGVKYNQLMINPEAAEIVALSEWTETNTTGVWRIQPSMISNHKNSNYSNAEQQSLSHVKYTLQPIITCLEQELNDKLFSERNNASPNPKYVKFNMAGLLRGDTAAQTAYLQAQRTSGVISADEWREYNDQTKQVDDKGETGIGGKYYIQGAMVEVGKEDEQVAQQQQRMMQEVSDVLNKYKINGHKISEQ